MRFKVGIYEKMHLTDFFFYCRSMCDKLVCQILLLICFIDVLYVCVCEKSGSEPQGVFYDMTPTSYEMSACVCVPACVCVRVCVAVEC